MRDSISTLDGKAYDVIVVGGGVNGVSAVQSLAAAGYDALLIEKKDFATGASGRSSRLLHCGLRYLAPGKSIWDFVMHPGRLAVALRMARQAMQSRAQFVNETPERVRQLRFCFPIWKDGAYSGWQVDLAFKILAGVGPSDVPLDYNRLSPSETARTPLVKWLRDADRLEGVAAFREYQFDGPERICVETALDAERLGATVRNYTALTGMEKAADGSWKVTIQDALAPAETATVRARIVLNTAGIWIDRVSGSAAGDKPRRRILGTKGTHIVVRLPDECRDYGVATINRVDEPFYCIPLRDLHYFGPTETIYEGDPDDVHPTEPEIEWLIAEANHLLPALRLKREDVLFSWSGVRPLTYDEALPKGKRSREIYDYAQDGMPNVYAMTAGPVMTHRSAGKELTDLVAGKLKPSRPAQPLSYAARPFPRDTNAPAFVESRPDVRLSDIAYAAEHEKAVSLADLMTRRTMVSWSADMGYAAAEVAARAAAPALGWDEDRIAAEVSAYRAHLEHCHKVKTTG
jgi:glycerol-3-phosphate dehydrogenase